MRIFGCRACEAKESEIAHLLVELTQVHKHLENAQARLCELTVPGSNQRAVPPPRVLKPAIVAEMRGKRPEAPENFPGYERPEPADRFEVT
jgi:hypothetical protein